MTDSEPCALTELPASWCAHCRQQELPKAPAPDWFPARFEGRCVTCGEPIHLGDDIAATDDGYICRRPHDD